LALHCGEEARRYSNVTPLAFLTTAWAR